MLLAVLPLLLSACERSSPEEPIDSKSRDSSAHVTSWLTDITESVGLQFTHHAGQTGQFYFPEIMGSGVALLDYDNDNDLDVYCLNGAALLNGVVSPNDKVTNKLFQQQSDGTFVDVTAESGTGDTGYGTGIAVGDYDTDGDLDMFVANYGQNTLFNNNGDGTFSDASTSCGLRSFDRAAWSTSAAFLDVDRDGDLDLFVANYLQYSPDKSCRDRAGAPDYCGPAAFEGSPDNLYLNNGDGTFSNISINSGVGKVRSRGLGVVCSDFTGDGWTDIYVANDGESNHLWVNQQNGTFVNEGLMRGLALNAMGTAEASMGIAVGDINNDGIDDIVSTHLHGESNTVYFGSADAGYQDATSQTGIGMKSLQRTGFGTALMDLNHDGHRDFLVVNGRVKREDASGNSEPPAGWQSTFWWPYAEQSQLFINNADATFAESNALAGRFAADFALGRGLSTGDIDNDGDIDLVVSRVDESVRVYRNDANKSGNWLIVDPRRSRSSPTALNAQVTIVTGDRRFTSETRSASSYQSAIDPRVHVGLGEIENIDEIIVRWPAGSTERFSGGAANQIVTLLQNMGSNSVE